MHSRPFSVAVFILLLTLSRPALAQSEDAPPQLEDLIPDSAVSTPENWAVDEGTGAQREEKTEDLVDPSFDEDTHKLPDLDAIDLSSTSGPADEPDPFASIAELPLPPTPQLKPIKIDEQLELAFPIVLMDRRTAQISLVDSECYEPLDLPMKA